MDFDCLELDNLTGFEWDSGNIEKNERKHGLKWSLIEEVFFNEPLIVVPDFSHSMDECRCIALGKTDDARLLMVVFTVRQQNIRVISARPMSRRERMIYEKS